MPETLDQLVSLVRQVWRRRLLWLAVAWPLAVLGWLAVILLPSRYESSARIFADTESLIAPLMKGMTVELEQGEQLQVMQRTLLSRPNLAQLVEETPLAKRVRNPEAKEGLIAGLGAAIGIVPQGLNLFTVTYRDRDPLVAAAVVQRLLDLFVASNQTASRRETEAARRFIEDQIGQQTRSLEAAEQRLADFQKANVDFMPGEKGYFERLQQARGDVVRARGDLEGAKAQRDELQRQLAALPATIAAGALSGLAVGPGIDTPQAQRLALERRLAELRNRYTALHPDVIATQRALAALGAGGAAGQEGQAIPNPVHEQIRLQLVQRQAEIASLETAVVKTQALVDELSGQARVMPEAEAEYKRLARDYEVIRKNYEELVARREAARIADDLRASNDQVAFRVVDPPQPALIPVSPPRLLLLPAVLVASLGAGIGFALLGVLRRRAFESVRELQQAYGLPVLGIVAEVRTAAFRRRSWGRNLGFAVAGSGLVALMVAVAAFESAQRTAPLRARFETLLAGSDPA